MPCHCGLEGAYETCCGRYVGGAENAPTAEALMRSRYSAYVEGAVDYIGETHHPDKREQWDRDAAATWSKNAQWVGLEVVETEDVDDDEGIVEFRARYTQEGNTITHHERSRFVRIDGRWYYDDGRMVAEPVKRSAPKVGRNDPCPCGSGKKYKKCCGARARA
ncbi:MAG: YchJ family protein [Deltaproteobacteria bacterium]